MRFNVLAVVCMLLAGCCSDCQKNRARHSEAYYVPTMIEQDYQPVKTGEVFHVAGFDVKQAQQMRAFFDEFEEPMHAKYVGNDNVEWTYYVDYDAAHDKGRIIRYCELDNYQPHSLCAMKVTFHMTYVSNATSNCR